MKYGMWCSIFKIFLREEHIRVEIICSHLITHLEIRKLSCNSVHHFLNSHTIEHDLLINTCGKL